MALSNPLVYIDTNVFVNKIILPLISPATITQNQTNLLRQTDNFLHDLVVGVYRGVTSTFTRTEYRGVMKRELYFNKQVWYRN